MGQSKRRRKGKNVHKTEHNVWSFLTEFSNGIFKLINNNKIWPVLFLMLMVILVLLTWKLPEEEVAPTIALVIREFVVGKGVFWLSLIITNLGWAYIFKRQKNIYSSEIARLAEVRSSLMHSNNSGQAANIKEHRSSKRECSESYVLPAKKNR